MDIVKIQFEDPNAQMIRVEYVDGTDEWVHYSNWPCLTWRDEEIQEFLKTHPIIPFGA